MFSMRWCSKLKKKYLLMILLDFYILPVDIVIFMAIINGLKDLADPPFSGDQSHGNAPNVFGERPDNGKLSCEVINVLKYPK